MEYAVRLVLPESPTTAQTLQSSSMNRIASGSCHVTARRRARSSLTRPVEAQGSRPWTGCRSGVAPVLARSRITM